MPWPSRAHVQLLWANMAGSFLAGALPNHSSRKFQVLCLSTFRPLPRGCSRRCPGGKHPRSRHHPARNFPPWHCCHILGRSPAGWGQPQARPLGAPHRPRPHTGPAGPARPGAALSPWAGPASPACSGRTGRAAAPCWRWTAARGAARPPARRARAGPGSAPPRPWPPPRSPS